MWKTSDSTAADAIIILITNVIIIIITESLKIGAQNNAIATNYLIVRINKNAGK